MQFTTFVPDDLWSNRVLQLAHSSTCIRHALVALSSYHERYWNGDVGGETAYGLRQYNMAINHVLEAGADQPFFLPIQLVSCTIFICIEVLRRNISNAVHLFKYGCRMIQDASRHARKGGYLAAGLSIEPVLRLVENFFSRISTQVYLAIGGDINHKLADIIAPMIKLRGAGTAPKRTIASIQEARESLLKLALQYRRNMGITQSRALAIRFSSWAAAFDSFRKIFDQNSLTKAEKRSLALLELHKRYMYINIAALNQADREDPSIWDQWTQEFRDMVDFAAEAAGLDAGIDASSQKQKPQFYMEIGIVPALFFLSAKCRDAGVRRRAIGIMQSNHIQEGIWNSEMAVKVAQKVIDFEEGNLGAKSSTEIDELARVRQVAVDAGPEVAYMDIGYELHGGWLGEGLG